MKVKEAVGCLFAAVLFGGGGLALLAWIFGFFSHTGAPIDNFDQLVAGVDAAIASGKFAPDLNKPEAEYDEDGVSLHIGDMARRFLEGKPPLPINSQMDPPRPLPKPVKMVDFDRKRIDAIDDSLPDALRAPSLDAAATIVFVHCSPKKIGNYGLFADGFSRICNELFVERSGPSGMRILGIAFFEKSPPAKIDPRFHFGDIVADRPESDLKEFIERWSTAQ